MTGDSYPNYAFGDTWQASHKKQPQPSGEQSHDPDNADAPDTSDAPEPLRTPSNLFDQIISWGFGHVDPREFESFVANVFACFGYSVELTPPIGDDGVDVVLTTDQGEVAIVQCKRYADTQYNTPAQVREFLGSMTLFKASYGFFITLCSVSQQAERYFADDHGIYLVDADALKRLALMAEQILLNPEAFESLRDNPLVFICDTLSESS